MALAAKGLEGIIANESKLSNVQGLEGKLSYLGYTIDDLVEHTSFEEVIYLLHNGKLPNQSELENLTASLKSNRNLPDGIIDFLKWSKNKNISMAVCTNKQERLAIDLLKKLDLLKFFEYVAGSDTFKFNKPDPRHLTDVVEIIGGNLKKTIMIGDSEVDAMSAHNAKLPFILVKDGYTEKTEKEIKHDELISDFVNFDKIIEKYL